MLNQADIATNLAVLLVVPEGAAENDGQTVDGHFDNVDQEALDDVNGSAVFAEEKQVARD